MFKSVLAKPFITHRPNHGPIQTIQSGVQKLTIQSGRLNHGHILTEPKVMPPVLVSIETSSRFKQMQLSMKMVERYVGQVLLWNGQKAVHVVLLSVGNKAMMSATDVTEQVTGPEIVLTIGIMVSVDLVAGTVVVGEEEEAVVVEVADTGHHHPGEGEDHDQGPETGRGDHLVAALAAGVGQGQEAAEIVVMTAKGEEVQRRVNLVVNPDPKVKAGLNPIAGLEVGHLLRMSTMVEKKGHRQDQGHGVEAGQRVGQIDDFMWSSCVCYYLRSAEMKYEIFYVLNTNSTDRKSVV